MTASSYTYATRSAVDGDRWDQAADMFPEAWLWHRRTAIDAYATWAATSDVSFALLGPEEGRVAALVPLHLISARWPLGRIFRRLESTGGPAYAPELTARQRREAERAVRDTLFLLARRHRAHRVDLALAPLAPALAGDGATSVNPLAMLGCKDSSTQSWVLELAGNSDDALWRNMEHRVRKAVNRAERAGVTARAITPADLPDFLSLHEKNAARAKLPTKPARYFETIFNDFLPNGQAAGFCALVPDGRIVAVHVFAVDKGGALYWVVASDNDALSSGANDFLQWHAIRQFASQGLARYECGEAFPGLSDGKLKRISDFKKGFGGTLRPYYRGTLTTRPVTGAVHDLLRAVRQAGTGGAS